MDALKYEIGGMHYKALSVQPIQIIYDLDFCRGNVIKYVLRHDKKNGLQDLDKAEHYLDFIKEFQGPSLPESAFNIKAKAINGLLKNCEITPDQAEACLAILRNDLDKASTYINKLKQMYENQ